VRAIRANASLHCSRHRRSCGCATSPAQRLPAFGLDGLGQYQSEVVTLPFQLPGGLTPPRPPHVTYDLHVEVQQPLLDPTREPRRAETRAQLAESQARVRTTIHALRQSVNDAYFGALLFGAQSAEITAALTDLEARLRAAEQREREGAALPSEANALRAELLRRRQDRAELDANRAAALAVLRDLTGRTVDTSAVLAEPVVADSLDGRGNADTLARTRPEYHEFAATRDHLSTQEGVLAAGEKPRLSAFARTGYGRPGLNVLNNTFEAYWLAGFRLQWTPWNWGRRRAIAKRSKFSAISSRAMSWRSARASAGRWKATARRSLASSRRS